MIDKNTPGRKQLIARIGAVTEELTRMDDEFDAEREIDTEDPMADTPARPSNKLDSLVHDCAGEMASEVNNNGMEGQLEFLLRNGWTPGDILGRVKIEMENTNEDDD